MGMKTPALILFVGIALISTSFVEVRATIWTPTGSLTQPRNSHTATLLRNRMVLIVGGSAATAHGRAPNCTTR